MGAKVRIYRWLCNTSYLVFSIVQVRYSVGFRRLAVWNKSIKERKVLCTTLIANFLKSGYEILFRK